MSSDNFIDYVKVYCQSGKGGDGRVNFHREKYVPKGGPDGGDGGKGGDIIVRGNKQLWTLLPLRHRKHIKAEDGEDGGTSNKTGADGDDQIVEVPLGTVIRNQQTGKVEAEIMQDQQEVVLLKGGEGGIGNAKFKSSTNQAPRKATPGRKGVAKYLVFELKILADVGLVGFPNAGKSTLLATLSKAKPEIADYPFTTVQPNIGIVPYYDYKSFAIADIPGIIKNAHKGKGLGDQFLRHIERNALLLFMVPVDSDDIVQEYKTLVNELENYNASLLDKERILALSKADLIDEELEREIKDLLPSDISSIFISAVSGKDLQELKDLIWEKLQKAGQAKSTP